MQQMREIRYFFSGQSFSDALRITFGIVLPSLLLAQINQLELGVIMSIGAFTVSLTDIPGTPEHKRNGMLLCCLCIFVVAFVTGFDRMHMLLLGAEILLFSFFFSMLPVYGNRAAVLGTAALLVMITLMGEPQQLAEVPLFSALVLAGGLWYTGLSLLFDLLMPYRAVQQALGECVRDVSRFLALKAQFYQATYPLDQVYQQLVAQQIVVNEKQETVRELLFKNRLLVKESTTTSRKLLLIFIELVDLFERSMLIHYDYAHLRQKFGASGVLALIAEAIHRLSAALDAVGASLQLRTPYQPDEYLPVLLQQLQQQIVSLEKKLAPEETLPLHKILDNLYNIQQRLHSIQHYPGQKTVPAADTGGLEYQRFVNRQVLDLKTFADNLSLKSAIFRHALRVAIACGIGFGLMQLLPYGGTHSYWVLLTIVVILKPAFSLTKQRNYQRIVGTLVGGFLGFLLLYFVQDQHVLFFLLVLLMVGAFSFLRINYVVFVVLLTPLVLILFSFFGEDNASLLQERLTDTFIGSVIAFAASYLLFPSWESEQLQRHMQAMVLANLAYLQTLINRLSGKQVPTAEYKLARKEVYVRAANLSAAFQRMLSEPRSKQKHSPEIHRFVVLNHILSSNIATLTATLSAGVLPAPALAGQEQLLLQAREQLEEAAGLSGQVPVYLAVPAIIQPEAPHAAQPAEAAFLQEQLALLLRICTDIHKAFSQVLGRNL